MKTIVALVLAAVLAACATTGPVEKDNKAEGYYNKGLSYLQRNDYANALAEFHRSIQYDPKFKMSYYALGVVYDRQDKLQEAEKYLKDAVSIDSDFSDAHSNLGTIYAKQKRWKEALKSYNRALENKTYSTPQYVWFNIGEMYMMQNDYAKAAEAYRESKKLAIQDITLYRLGMALLASGKPREAVAEFQESLSLSPKNVEIRLALALAHLKDGNSRSALSEFRTIVEIAPKSDAAKTAQDYIARLGKNDAPAKRTK